jgi:hypothetical protein
MTARDVLWYHGRMDKSELYQLIDELPEGEELAARRFLEYLRDRHVEYTPENAPFDDEPLTEEDKIALAEADEDIRAGRVVSDKEVWSHLGL